MMDFTICIESIMPVDNVHAMSHNVGGYYSKTPLP